jgi:hypothetical protein
VRTAVLAVALVFVALGVVGVLAYGVAGAIVAPRRGR